MRPSFLWRLMTHVISPAPRLSQRSVIHFQMNPHHLVCTWEFDPDKLAAAGPEFNLLWERFLDGEDEYRDARFKVPCDVYDS